MKHLYCDMPRNTTINETGPKEVKLLTMGNEKQRVRHVGELQLMERNYLRRDDVNNLLQ